MPAHALSRICYVEDDEDIQRIVRMSLERIGKMTVQLVSDPLQALGAAGVISKPFSPKDLPDQLRAIWSALP